MVQAKISSLYKIFMQYYQYNKRIIQYKYNYIYLNTYHEYIIVLRDIVLLTYLCTVNLFYVERVGWEKTHDIRLLAVPSLRK